MPVRHRVVLSRALGFGVSRESISSDGVHLVLNGERMAFIVQPLV
ncbi:hypothetical protein [Streptomyces sp. G-G2]|nr:hypothetical protein [Streptomyces sp. G-G2]MDJ0383576.1 hypothetical protein [Streptomyces sp. G-G2]